MICPQCQMWIQPQVDPNRQTVQCPECGHAAARPMLPLFIVTGASASGKTAVLETLYLLLPDWEIFETDILWDSGGDWNMIKCNWLRIANALALRGRPTILCGTISPTDLAACDCLPFFETIHWLGLHCDDATRLRRLQSRPVWRGSTDAFNRETIAHAHWFLDNAQTAFAPPLEIVDTTNAPVERTAEQIRDWAVRHWNAFQERR